MENPKELKYTKEHEWVKVEEDNVVIGVTDFAQHLLTDIVFVELPEMGKEIEQGKPFMVIESVKSVSDIFCPISGEVVEINQEAIESPEIINEDPYGKGWLIRLNPSNPNQLDQLMSASEYEIFLESLGH